MDFHLHEYLVRYSQFLGLSPHTERVLAFLAPANQTPVLESPQHACSRLQWPGGDSVATLKALSTYPLLPTLAAAPACVSPVQELLFPGIQCRPNT